MKDQDKSLEAATAACVKTTETQSLFSALSTLAFGEAYAERAGVTLQWLVDKGHVPFICHCGEEGCEGFGMSIREVAAAYVERGQMEDPCGWLAG